MDKNIINYINNNEVCAIIPARSGSKGVKDKNICLLHGYPIIAYSIAAAKLSKKINRIIVSTDSEKYAEIARKFGAETPFLRPAEYAADESKDIDFMKHAIQCLYDSEGSVPEYFVHLRPTNPLRNPKIIEDAIKTFVCDIQATSLRSAHLATSTPYKWFKKTLDGYYMPLFDGYTLDEINNQRQKFSDVYIPDGYVDVLRTSFICSSGLLHGDKMIAFISPESVDVDAKKDIQQLEYELEYNPSILLDYLKSNFEEETY